MSQNGKAKLVVLPITKKRPAVSTLELAECVTLDNEIRVLRAKLEDKRAHLRRCIESGAEIEDGPLKSFAARIARVPRVRKPRQAPQGVKRAASLFGRLVKRVIFASAITLLVKGD